jgi:hypothetical protein
MNTVAKKQKVTLMLDVEVYKGLVTKLGSRGIGAYLSNLARPHVVASDEDIEAGYAAMAADEEYNKMANEWIEGVHEPIVTNGKEEIWKY